MTITVKIKNTRTGYVEYQDIETAAFENAEQVEEWADDLNRKTAESGTAIKVTVIAINK